MHYLLAFSARKTKRKKEDSDLRPRTKATFEGCRKSAQSAGRMNRWLTSFVRTNWHLRWISMTPQWAETPSERDGRAVGGRQPKAGTINQSDWKFTIPRMWKILIRPHMGTIFQNKHEYYLKLLKYKLLKELNMVILYNLLFPNRLLKF